MELPMQVRTARDLGAAVKKARRDLGFSQAALAEAVGIHQPKISALERGATGVRLGLVLQILRTLDLVVTLERAEKPPGKRLRKAGPDDFDLDAIANTGIK